jgi:opacity protein-like surface antigen
VYLGAAHTRPASLTLRQPAESTSVTLSPVGYRSESLDAPLYYGYRIGYFPKSSWFGIEGELIHLKVIADTARTVAISGTLRNSPANGSLPLSAVIQHFSLTHGVNLLLLNGVFRHPLGDGVDHPRWLLTGRLGAGASVPHAESTINGRHVEGYEWGELSVQAAGGLEVSVARRVSVLAEYKLTHSRQDVGIADGSAQTALTTHHVVAGLSVRLGLPRR